MSQINQNSEDLNKQNRPRAPVLPEDKFSDADTDDFCFYKVQRLPLKVSINNEVGDSFKVAQNQ